MTKSHLPKDPENGFSSREINFLKYDSEHEPPADFVPNEYISDRMIAQSSWMEAFIGILENAKIPGKSFVCGVIQQGLSPELFKGEATINATNSFLNSWIKPSSGIWARIDDTSIVMVLWDKKKTASTSRLIKIKKNMALETGIDPTMGIAIFPFMDFSRKETFYNAVRAVDHAAFLGPGSEAHFNDVSMNISGDRLYHLGHTNEASMEYQKGLEINPNNTNLINSLGVCHGISNHPKEAKEAFERAIKTAPTEVMAIYNLGLVFDIMDERNRAIQLLEQASQINNSIFEVELTAGSLLVKEQRFDLALIHLTRATTLNAKASIPFKLLGEIYLGTGRTEEAINEFKRAIKINPSDAVSLSGLAHAFGLKGNNLQIAITLAKQSIMIDPETPIFRLRLGELYLKTDQEELARIEFNKAKQQPRAETSSNQESMEKRSA